MRRRTKTNALGNGITESEQLRKLRAGNITQNIGNDNNGSCQRTDTARLISDHNANGRGNTLGQQEGFVHLIEQQTTELQYERTLGSSTCLPIF